ncbi:MAG: MBL fold metallo-hydrolase [Nitrospinota bacterium]
MKEILPDIFTWSEFSEEKQLNFNGYLLVSEEESVLIDPPGMSDTDLTELGERAGRNSASPLKAILLTNVHHERASGELAAKLNVPVWIHEKDYAGLERKAEKTFNSDEGLPCGLKTFNFENQKSPGESGFFLEERRLMFVGDALIGKVPGKVNMLPPEKYNDFAQAKNGLHKIFDFDFDCLLVGDGESILQGAKDSVKNFLER